MPPLASRMRPNSLDEVVGQDKLLAANSPLRRLVEGDRSRAPSSILLWGPPGSGKTTIARLISGQQNTEFVELSAISAGVGQVREVIDASRKGRDLFDQHTVLFIDEIHRFNKTQQDALLAAVESGDITLIAATTENPSFSVVRPLISRSLVFQLEPVSEIDTVRLLERALSDERGLPGVTAAAEALERIATLSFGDARRALSLLEAAAALADGSEVSVAHVTETANSVTPYDADGDAHYDTISAFIKSVRGSDVDAALHYLARMISGGEDSRFIARRLIILAAEDVGLADPQALTLAVSAADAVALIGMPEGRIPLSEATIYLSLAPKSNRAYQAINAALAEIEQGGFGPVPAHLKSSGGVGYKYPHDSAAGIVAQHYRDGTERYFLPTEHGFEKTLATRLDQIRRILNGE
jgi:putative ATPase